MLLLLLQIGPPQTPWQMVTRGSLSTLVVLGVLAVFSVLSWVLIFWKVRQFRKLQADGAVFVQQMERARGLEEAYRMVTSLPDSAYARVFRQGVNFFSELRPGSLREGAPVGPGLSLTQLEALRMVLEKAEAEERDELSGGLPWLSIIASIAPLLGLLGTVIGVMNAFLGITASGSTNIGAVAPGVAEALITTVAGLFVAIPAVIGFNHFLSRLSLFESEIDGFSSEFIGTLAREGRL